MPNNDIDYLACTLIGEARGEPIEGIIAVANVIQNRAIAARKPFKAICLEKNQFSCWNDADSNSKYIRGILNDLAVGNEINDPYLRQCLAVATVVKSLVDNVNGAKNYVNLTRYQLAMARRDSKLDKWILDMKEVARYGKHVFLKDVK